MDSDILTRRIAVAAGREPADLVIKNGRIIDVFNAEMIRRRCGHCRRTLCRDWRF